MKRLNTSPQIIKVIPGISVSTSACKRRWQEVNGGSGPRPKGGFDVVIIPSG